MADRSHPRSRARAWTGPAVLLAAVGLTLGIGVAAMPAQADDEYKVLVVGKTLGFRHSHIDDTTNAIIQMGAEHGFTVDVWDNRLPALTLSTTPLSMPWASSTM